MHFATVCYGDSPEVATWMYDPGMSLKLPSLLFQQRSPATKQLHSKLVVRSLEEGEELILQPGF